MGLRGKKPHAIEKRLKALFYGSAGVGKTTAAIQFPSPYLIDTERGAEHDQYTELLNDQGGVIFQTNQFDELVTEVRSLLTESHQYKTLVIDPLTTIYDDLVDNCARQIKLLSDNPNSTGMEFGRHISAANQFMKQLFNLLMRLDMNVIITSHAKPEYSDEMKILGQTFDCYKKTNYWCDLVLEIQKRGKERVGIVRKTRIQPFAELDCFTFSYQAIATKYGKNILEKMAAPETLATSEQISELQHLISLLKFPADQVDKWLAKAHASSIEEMETSNIQKCIDFLNEKIQTKEVA